MSTEAIATTSHKVDGIEGLVVVIDAEVLARRDELTAARTKLGPITEHNILEADQLVGRYSRHNKSVEEGRKAFKAPYLLACQLIDEAARDATLTTEGAALAREVAAARKVIEAKAREAAEARERAAREAEAAQRRAEEEAAERARAIAELEAKVTTAEDEAVLEELRAESEAAEEQAKTEAAAVASQAWLAAADRESTPPPRIKTHGRKVKKLKIVNADLIPRVVNGIECMKPEEAAITRLLRANVPVGGCVLEEVEEVSAGRRT